MNQEIKWSLFNEGTMNGFILEEYKQAHELLRYYHQVHFTLLRMYFLLYTGIWVGFTYLSEKFGLESVRNFVFGIGAILGFIFVYWMITNRYYELKQREKIDAIREAALEEAADPITTLIMSSSAKENLRQFRLVSSLSLSYLLMGLAGGLLIWNMEFSAIVWAQLLCTKLLLVLIYSCVFIAMVVVRMLHFERLN